MIYLLLDTSYVIFYRYYALLQWWKMAKKDEELGDPYQNIEFVEKFEKTFLDTINIIKKKLKIHKEEVCVIAAKDCPRTEIWRNKVFPEYKANRTQDDKFMGGPFFKKVYNENLLQKSGVNYIFKYPELEADDIVAIIKKYIHEKDNDAMVYIITNDQDYLQLFDEKTLIYNLKFKLLNSSKKSYKNPEIDLFSKIILGDKSDNIPSLFTKCGPKTLEKYINNPNLFESDLDKYNLKEKYLFNKKIIDFTEIPIYLVNTFLDKNKLYLDKIVLKSS
jgi:5'-3' exonuclease